MNFKKFWLDEKAYVLIQSDAGQYIVVKSSESWKKTIVEKLTELIEKGEKLNLTENQKQYIEKYPSDKNDSQTTDSLGAVLMQYLEENPKKEI